MTRRRLVQHLQQHGCVLLREGGNHSIFYNPTIGTTAPVPRHREISDRLARRICLELGIPPLP